MEIQLCVTDFLSVSLTLVHSEMNHHMFTILLCSLPEVPCLSEVACIAVDLPQSAEGHLVEQLQDFGRVLGRAPVQVVEISPRPGALLVHWAEV